MGTELRQCGRTEFRRGGSMRAVRLCIDPVVRRQHFGLLSEDGSGEGCPNCKPVYNF